MVLYTGAGLLVDVAHDIIELSAVITVIGPAFSNANVAHVQVPNPWKEFPPQWLLQLFVLRLLCRVLDRVVESRPSIHV